MRILETIFTVVTVILMIGLFLPAPVRNPSRPAVFLASAGLIILILHFAVEQYRWQMVPLYILFVIISLIWLFPMGDRGWLGWVGISLLALLTVLFILPPFLFPIRHFPTPTGNYPVGTLSEVWTDTERKEIYGDDPAQSRTFVTQTWYPADPNSPAGERAEYIPTGRKASRSIAGRLGLPFFVLDHVDLIQTNSFVNRSPADGQFPILIFSHGYNSFRGQSTTIMEDLASHGYIVVSMSHSYGSAVTIFPDGRIVFHNPDTLIGTGEVLRETGLKLGDQWGGDIKFIIDQLEAQQIDATHLLNGRLDLENLGVFGHSTGGGVALNVCAQDSRCKATMGLDAWLGPTPDDVIAAGSPTPTYFLMSEFWPKTINTNRIREYDKTLQAHLGQQWPTRDTMISQTSHFYPH